MKKHKNKIIVSVIILAALSLAWFWGGNYNSGQRPAPGGQAADERLTIGDERLAGEAPVSGNTVGHEANPDSLPNVTDAADAPLPVSESRAPGSQNPQTPGQGEADAHDEETQLSPPEPSDELGLLPAAYESPESAADPEFTPELSPEMELTPELSPEMELNPDTGLDNYQTSQVPEGRPAPVEPQDMEAGDGSFIITLTVRCDMILDNMNLLKKEKHGLVPDDGVIFPTTAVTAYEGESVFNVLQREMRRAGIHMEFRNTPIYNSAYIEAINNIYEFDVGELSGWMYKVNGWFPNYGSSRYLLQHDDTVEWLYTCDLGRDLGEYWLGGNWGQLDD